MKSFITIVVLLFGISGSLYANDLTDPFRPDDISTNLQGYWKLDEASGTRVDTSTNGNDLTDNNTVLEDTEDYWDLSEGSADFELDNSEYLSILHASQTGLGVTSSFSISGWVKKESNPATFASVISKYNSGSSIGYSLAFFSSGALRLFIDLTSFASTSTIPNNVWTHIACTFNDTTDVVSLYINGNLDSVSTYAGAITDSGQPFMLGANSTGSGVAELFYDGVLKDAAVWNKVLTSLEIKSLAMGIDIDTFVFRPADVGTGTTAYWKLNEISDGTSTSRLDSSGNSHTLTDKNTVGSLSGFTEGVGANFERDNSEAFSAADSSDWDFDTGDLTISFWMKTESFVGGTAIIAQTNSTGDFNERWGISYSATNLRFYNITGGTATVDHDKTVSFVADTWYHIGITRSGTTFETYVDGVSVGTTTDSSPFDDFTGDLFIGQLDAVSGEGYYDGLLADFAIWKGTALSSSDIKSLAAGVPIQQSGIVSYWKMDEGSGNATDSIGSNTLTDNGTVGTGTGQVGSARDFEDTNSEYFSITDGSQSGLDIVNDITLMAWYNPETVGANDNVISKDVGVTGYSMRIDNTNKSRIEIVSTDSDSTTSLSTSTWYHVVGTYDRSNIRNYLGSVNETTTALTTAMSDNADDFNIGADDETNFFDGLIDEVVIANRWFREEEVKASYNKGKNAKEVTSTEKSGAAPAARRVLIF